MGCGEKLRSAFSAVAGRQGYRGLIGVIAGGGSLARCSWMAWPHIRLREEAAAFGANVDVGRLGKLQRCREGCRLCPRQHRRARKADKWMDLSSVAAVTTYRKLSGLKQHQVIAWRPEARPGSGGLPPLWPGRPWPSPASGGFPHRLIPGPTSPRCPIPSSHLLRRP